MPASLWHTRWFKTLAGVVLLLALAVWNPSDFLRPARVAVTTVFQPFEGLFAFGGFKLAGIMNFFRDIDTLKEENSRLFEENQQFKLSAARIGELERENEELRSTLGLLPRDRFTLSAAEIIGSDTEHPGHWILVNKGSRHGIADGMAVIVGQGIVIGRVEEVWPISSRVMLLTHPGSVVNAADSRTGARGVVRGQFGSGLLLDMVFQTDQVESKDTIITSGLGDALPRGLLIGEVSDLRETPDRLFRQAAVVSPIEGRVLRAVFVVINALREP